MVKPAAKRRVVGYLEQAFGMSQRRACRVIDFCRASGTSRRARIRLSS